MARTQANRQAAVMTPLGEDVLLLKHFTATEQLGRPFRIELELLSEQHELKFEDIIGQNVSVRLALANGKSRYFNGYVSRFVQAPSQGDLACYRATLVPWLWFMTRLADCRIFQELSAPDIIQQVFRDHGFTDFKVSLSDTYRKRDYCVQYRETDFNFVSRLMEQEGIYYFFEHENGKHVLVLADSKSAHQPFPEFEKINHRFVDQPGIEEDYIYDLTVEKEVQSGIVSLNDFDFEKPKNALMAKATVTRSHAVPNLEQYDYPGEYVEFSDGEAYARRRIEALQAQYEQINARARSKGICTGHLFTLEGHTRGDQNREYLVTAAAYEIRLDPYGSTPERGRADFFLCSFTAIQAETPFRTARTTPIPTIQGPQTALVVGPAGEEIHTDKYGRVKVQFHWDHRGKADENSSCWIRVSQLWAGKGWGAIYLPRIGQEVIVEFLEGDPDRPLITGRVYNAESMPPYPLPDQKTVTSVKSNSSKGGRGFNEIRFEDSKGDEQIFVHAEKDLNTRVKHNTYETVCQDRHLRVENDQIEYVKQDRQEMIARDHVKKVVRDHHLTIGGKEAIEVTGSQSLTVKDDVIQVFEKNRSEKVTKDLYIKAKNIVIEAEENITINVGDSYVAIEKTGIKIATDGEIVFEAKKNITQKATLDFKLEASKNLSVKGTAGLNLESPAQAELSSALTTVKADGVLTVQGSLVKIN